MGELCLWRVDCIDTATFDLCARTIYILILSLESMRETRAILLSLPQLAEGVIEFQYPHMDLVYLQYGRFLAVAFDCLRRTLLG